MKRLLIPSALVIVLSLLAGSCSNGDSSGALLALIAERDSLRASAEAGQQRLARINEMVSTINSALDSISVQENMLFVDPETEIPVSRDDAIRNLARYEQVLRHQQQRIDELRAGIGVRDSSENMAGMVEVLQQQLAAKDRQIAQLRTELEKKDVDIDRLRRQVESQRTQIEQQSQAIVQLDRTTKAQGQALERQDEFINSAYVIVGSKKDLERKGIIKKKRLIPESALDRSKFAKVDIRKYREVTFTAKKPKILTDMPRQAYSLTTDGQGNFTLRINSPDEFWRISSFLVIQTD